MKKYIIFSILVCLLGSSCDDFLEEKDYGLVVPSTYPQSLGGLEKCVTSLYSIANTMYKESGSFVPCMAGDDVTTQAGGKKANFLQFDTFSGQDNNELLWKPWDYAYNTIKQANVIINTIDNIKEADKDETYVNDQKNRGLGQAYFLRALAYFNLVRFFGEVPIIDNIEVNYTATKAPFSDIYTHIINDLTKAEQLLPLDYKTAANASDLEKTTSYSRATLGAVKSLMASVYLSWAGYPLKDASKYALAAQKANEVISKENEYGYRLLPDYADLWKWENGWKDIRNDEDVFTCHYNHTAGDWSDNGTDSNGNTWGPCSLTPETFGGWSDVFAELAFFYNFPEGPRKEATFLTKGQYSLNDPIIEWKDFTGAHPYYKKYMDIEGFEENNMGKYIDWWGSRTVQVIRYAEVLLIYAEAQAMADGTPNALAYNCLNRVRNRAGLEDAKAGMDGSTFRNAVIEERKWEFAGLEPCSRWFDMVRTETVAAATANRNTSEVAIIGKPNDSTHEGYFAPIPQKDTLLNPDLK